MNQGMTARATPSVDDLAGRGAPWAWIVLGGATAGLLFAVGGIQPLVAGLALLQWGMIAGLGLAFERGHRRALKDQRQQLMTEADAGQLDVGIVGPPDPVAQRQDPGDIAVGIVA